MSRRKIGAFVAIAFLVGIGLGAFLKMPNWGSVRYKEGAAFYSVVKSKTLVTSVLTEELGKTSLWNGRDVLSISPNDAVLAAQNALTRASVEAVKPWKFESMQLRHMSGKYYYVVTFQPEPHSWQPTWEDPFAYYHVIVYLTGKVQLPAQQTKGGT